MASGGGFDLGFLGGGQLARMSILAAKRLGIECVSVDPQEDSPAGHVAPSVTGDLRDPEVIAEVFRNAAVVTLENEFVPAATIRAALEQAKIEPGRMVPDVEVLATVQDKLLQRQALNRAGVPSPVAVALEGDGEVAIAKVGFPMMLKQRFGSYDGRGTVPAHDRKQFHDQQVHWGQGGWLAETYVPFQRELAVIAYRWRKPGVGILEGAFPTMETVQTHHVCDLVFPADTDASEVAIAAVRAIEGFGLFGVELFQLPDGSVQVNEIAPRPHNTGHYTLDWGGVSQFDQHVRLALGLSPAAPFGAPTCMANLLGKPHVGDWRRAMIATLEYDPDIRFHWYEKAESRPGRKMGHLNAVGVDIVERAKLARDVFYGVWCGGECDQEPISVSDW